MKCYTIPARERKRIAELAQKEADKERNDIATRAQYIWAMAMLQAGLAPRTVQKVCEMVPAVAEKYAEYQTESLGDLFMRETLKDRGVTMPQTSGEVKRR